MAYQYKCSSGKCVEAASWCNGTVECDDGSDEINCTCKRDEFRCPDGSCINVAKRCNGRRDCQPGGEDEQNCGKLSTIESIESSLLVDNNGDHTVPHTESKNIEMLCT